MGWRQFTQVEANRVELSVQVPVLSMPRAWTVECLGMCVVDRKPTMSTAPPAREIQLQNLLVAYVTAGLLFMLLPGTFLGVWNLISISSEHSVSSLSASWIQAHGHAQIFGWIGTFIIGIGYYALSKMGTIAPFAVSRGWLSW